MRWLVTFFMTVLVGAGVAWLLVEDRIRTAIGIPKIVSETGSETLKKLQSLRSDSVSELRITPPGYGPLTLNKTADGSWNQPGNWPLRDSEIAALLNTLTTLRTRFAAIPLDASSPDLAQYGLDQTATLVEILAELKTPRGAESLRLTFGQPAESASNFDRPCYLRVDALNEVIRLGPDVFPLLARSPEVYRRRQLLADADRIKLSGDSGPSANAGGRIAILGDKFKNIAIERTGENPVKYTLNRVAPTPEAKRELNRATAEPSVALNTLAQSWQLQFSTGSKPPVAGVSVVDRLDPTKLKNVLTTVPDLWVEGFIPSGNVTLAAAELEKPTRTITINRADGKALVLFIGKEIRTTTKTEAPPAPPMFGAPPPPPKIIKETYCYAKLKDNELIFELRTDKLDELFSDPQELRDSQLARFDASDVVEVTITPKGKPPITLKKKRGDKDAEKDDEKQDRWYVGELLADSAKVSEILDPLSRLEAKGRENLQDAVDAGKLKELELAEPNTKISVKLQPEVAKGETPPAPKSLSYDLGKVDNKKLSVRVAGWDRVNLVDDAIVKQLERPAIAYRSRRLFDTTELKLETLTVKRDNVVSFALGQKPKAAPETGTVWSLTQPLSVEADDSKSSQLTGDFSRLEVIEYVEEGPKPEDLDKKYGLTKPKYLVEASFSGPNAKPKSIEIGNAREGKPEVYARLPGSPSIFAIKKEFVDLLEGGATALLPLQFWSVSPDKITALEISRPGSNEKYKLNQDGKDWKLSGPFDATADGTTVQPLLTAAATLKADKFDALQVDPVKHGLDKPSLKVSITYKEEKPGAKDQPIQEVSTTKTLLLGNPSAPGAATRFAKVEGGTTQAVFIIPDALFREADKPALARLDKVLLSIDATRVSKVQLSHAIAEQSITLVKDDKTSTWKADGANFPIDLMTLDGLIFGGSRPPVQRLVAYGAGIKWADYGLEPAAQTITLTVGGEKPTTHIVQLGKTEPNGERYIRVQDKAAVGVIPARVGELLARTKLDFVDRNLFNFDPAGVSQISRKQDKAELELNRTGLNWEISKPAKQKADQATLSELAENLARLRATKVAAFAPADADLDTKFGLKNPGSTISLKISDKETRVLKIGKLVDASKPEGERYVSVDGANAPIIGTLGQPLLKKLLAEPVKFRDRFLAKFVDADKITMTRGERTVTFSKVNGTWKLTAPLSADAEQGELDELVNALGNLSVDELSAEKPTDLKPFGLATPEVKWQLFANDKVVLNLLIGSKEKVGSRVHAMLDKGEVVGLLEPGLSTRVTSEYRKRAVFTDLDAAQVDGVIISGGFNLSLQKSPDGKWIDPAKPTEPIDTSVVTDLVAALGSLKLERFVVDEKAKLGLYGLETPSQVIVISAKGQPARSLQIGNKVGGTNGKQVYAKLPDQTAVFILSEADTAKLTRDRAGYSGKK
jgi:hypothetical protein